VHVGESRFPRTAVSNVGMATGDIYEMNNSVDQIGRMKQHVRVWPLLSVHIK